MKRVVGSVLGVVVLGLVYFNTGLFAAAPTGEATPRQPLLGRPPELTLWVQLLRHGTLLISANDARLLVDPMLARAGSLPPIAMTSNRVKNPLIELPCDEEELLRSFDAVLVTHLHPDHFDDEAEQRLPKDTPLFCQPADVEQFAAMGFTHVQAIDDAVEWHGLRLTRHEVHHAIEPWLRDAMGPSSAYVISNGTSDLMLTGDAVLDEGLRALVSRLQPRELIANAGAAQLLFGSPITLTPQSLQAVLQLSPATHVHAIHLEALNHCQSRRRDLAAFVRQNGLEQAISLPLEGERWAVP